MLKRSYICCYTICMTVPLIPKYASRRGCALATILLSTEPSFLYLLDLDLNDLPKVWKKLANKFQKKLSVNKLALWRKLYALQLKEEKSVQTPIKTMTEISDELTIVGGPLDDKNKVAQLLTSLPKSKASVDVPKIDVVIERLLHEESTQNKRWLPASKNPQRSVPRGI